MKLVKTAKGTELPVSQIQGKDYLNVAYRIVWFREEHPDWSIETEMVSSVGTNGSGPEQATFKAVIRNEKAQLIATAHKTEDKKGFFDFMEKAETGAIGRALALCGYGTQFTDDLEEGGRLADAPIQPITNTSYDQNAVLLQILMQITHGMEKNEILENEVKSFIITQFKKGSIKVLTHAEAVKTLHHLNEFKKRAK